MALPDPTMFEFCAIAQTEESATEFARQRHLLLSDADIRQQQQQQQQQCLLGTPGCNGEVKAATKTENKRGKVFKYEGFRCNKCKRFRSAKNAVVNGEIRGAAPGNNELRSFFATVAMMENLTRKYQSKQH